MRGPIGDSISAATVGCLLQDLGASVSFVVVGSSDKALPIELEHHINKGKAEGRLPLTGRSRGLIDALKPDIIVTDAPESLLGELGVAYHQLPDELRRSLIYAIVTPWGYVGRNKRVREVFADSASSSSYSSLDKVCSSLDERVIAQPSYWASSGYASW